MVSLIVVFGMFILMFGIIGAMRGWAKELLVTSAVILGLFLNAILENYVPPYRTALFLQPDRTQLIVRGAMIVLLAFFGYQTPALRALQPKVRRERIEELLLGLVLGLLNGYLLIGSLWYHLHQVDYLPESDLIIWPPPGMPELVEQVNTIVAYLPPSLLPIPQLYFAVGVVFVFIIVVFV